MTTVKAIADFFNYQTIDGIVFHRKEPWGRAFFRYDETRKFEANVYVQLPYGLRQTVNAAPKSHLKPRNARVIPGSSSPSWVEGELVCGRDWAKEHRLGRIQPELVLTRWDIFCRYSGMIENGAGTPAGTRVHIVNRVDNGVHLTLAGSVNATLEFVAAHPEYFITAGHVYDLPGLNVRLGKELTEAEERSQLRAEMMRRDVAYREEEAQRNRFLNEY